MSAPHPVAPIGRLALAALAGIALAGCATTSTLEPTAVAATPGADLTAQTSPVATTAASASPAAEARLSCEPLGEPMPRYTVTVPGGWSGYQGECGFVVRDGEGFTAGLSAWIVGQVPTDPCRNSSTLATPEDGVDGLVKAILAQEGRNATNPVDVSLAGFQGTYVEWTVPAEVQFTDGDEYHAVGCDNENYLELERPYRRDPLSAGARAGGPALDPRCRRQARPSSTRPMHRMRPRPPGRSLRRSWTRCGSRSPDRVVGTIARMSGDLLRERARLDIYTFSTDGSDFTQIARGDKTFSGESLSWSPDGSRIAYTTGCVDSEGTADRAGCHLAIADGSNVRTVEGAISGPWHPVPR